MKFNEDTRVKLPTILHLTRLGYDYLSLSGAKWDENTNIFDDIFKKSIQRINPDSDQASIDRALEEIKLSLDNDDLGKAFYERLSDISGLKIIDYERFDQNSFNVVTELTYKNGDEEFRPDITLLINGLPLFFVEVKKPNNREGVLAEQDRINKRFQNPKFKRYVNITQLMVFSNNMEYDDGSPLPIEGAFYASASYEKPAFNYFREDRDVETLDLSRILADENEVVENFVLKDNNLSVIKHSPEFITNKAPNTPTNRICTSLFSRERIAFLLMYGLAYVNEVDGIHKHIMRYPQFFATRALASKLKEGVRKGIIWHTQGSGKTALAYYNVRHLTDFFQKQSVVPKFYFIVDRLDLLIQAHREFTCRGLVVHTVNSREEFARDIKSTGALHNLSGKPEITVVNIQKFADDPDVVRSEDYDISVQRIYFLDEVHRSYNPQGSFLANLTQSDTNAIKIGLTGTPLLGSDYNSRSLFGNYIHKYYYNSSIADGYTLRLIREEIASNYKLILQQALDQIEVQLGDVDKRQVFAHTNFVEPMLDYIVTDFQKSRVALGDETIGGMVICDSAEQAKKMFALFESAYARKAEGISFSAALILHDVGTKEERKDQVEAFKAGKIDFLFVYNMLLTGFDAKRLKKLYLGRIIKDHNLLQALTRVNRPYKDFRYGYVVDFADIRKEFDKTNKAYFDELQSELGDEMEHYSNLFKSREEIETEIEQIKDILFHFDTNNAEIFSQQVSQIQSKEQVQALKKALGDAKNLYNLIRLFGHYDLLEKLDFQKLNALYREVSNHLDLLNLKENLENSNDTTNILNVALEDVVFLFKKIGEEELILADKLKNTLRMTREALASNFDQQDPKFTTLKEELERLFKKKNLSEVTQEEMNLNISSLNKIHERIKELNRQNDLLKTKYRNDPKYARIHKRLMEKGTLTNQERRIHDALLAVKERADDQVMQNAQLLDNEKYFERLLMPMVIDQFINRQKIDLDAEASDYINGLVAREYMNEYNSGMRTW